MSTSADHDEAATSIGALLSWASARGIKLNGIAPKPLAGRGIGIVATRDLEIGEEVLHVPSASLRTIANTQKGIKSALKGATVHAILACSLYFDLSAPSEDFIPWRDVFPSEKDVRGSLPLCWDVNLQSCLPPTSKTLLAKQRKKFEVDFALVQSAFPTRTIDERAYLYAWLLVNTRTFYHTTPATERETPREDRMALQPVADLLNHSPTRGCKVSYDSAGFKITTRVAHRPGDEVFIQYGPHGNDFLLVEYGFILEQGLNPFDEVCLDRYILPKLGNEEKQLLSEQGFYERYMLDAETVCYRTQVALRCALLSEPRWRDFLDGLRGEEEDQGEVDGFLGDLLAEFESDVHAALAQLDAIGAGAVDEGSRAALRERWVQIKQLIVLARHRLING